MVDPSALESVVKRCATPALAALAVAVSMGATGCGGSDGNASVETGGATTFPAADHGGDHDDDGSPDP
ncbi:MAG: hypothetical protein LH616_17040 [Ilumatobacteraceae bacterium]|nr:hypothetical protein [Ilumatobacteraceae bacterium]